MERLSPLRSGGFIHGTMVVALVMALGVVSAAGQIADSAGQADAATSTSLDGYWMVDQRGHVHTFGNAPHLGEGPFDTIDMAATRSGSGYWLVTGAGDIAARGDAPELGGRPPLGPGESVVAIAGDPTSNGAWLFTSRGNVHARGGAAALGGAGSIPLNQPVIDAAPTPDGGGYWLVARDGGVFAFGNAGFFGSMGGVALNGPVVGLVPAPDGQGYWLVADDGGIFTFGNLAFHGSMGGRPLNRPVNGMVAAGGGYLMVADDGGAFTFGPGVHFHGSLGATPIPWKVMAIEPVPAGTSPQPLGPNPEFRSWAEPVPASRIGVSWRPGCPVQPSDLYLITVDHWDMYGRIRTGELVVNIDQAVHMIFVMRQLFDDRFPIAQMELIDLYGGNDDASMAANNTSAFNCRAVTGGTTYSTHSWGRAMDVNPVQNPYVRGALVLPPSGAPYASNRNPAVPGLISGSSPIVSYFAQVGDGGWIWGGNWRPPSATDYQHFEAVNAERPNEPG